MSGKQDFREGVRRIFYRLMGLFSLFMIAGAILIYYMIDPDFSAFKSEKNTYVVMDAEEDIDRIENGIHVRTGLKEGEGLMVVVNNCTNCHSAKLVTQNRMSEARWNATIKWMQETQNLWDLGKNQDVIVSYLVSNYPVEDVGRRASLTNIEWYELED
ncbi:monoheme cytochrome C [uncultured Psychroserpens sp.]|uniref:monoheme cytochrome C n=1 Tax=uncultured Psychroserpens sp. TaxID=255436 RepID=UPI002625A45A|nr:monoheme cytochrome C [uncultured Psychroserpens sp.]